MERKTMVWLRASVIITIVLMGISWITVGYSENFFNMPVVSDILIPYEERELSPAFVDLCDMNPDTIGWINTGANVDYPILYRDNDFYMNHGFDGKPSNSGAIFLDVRNSKEMNDDCLVIYGHNMRSGMMFGDLDDYRNYRTVQNDPIIYIHNAKEADERKYVYFALFDASMNFSDSSFFKITHFNFSSPEEKQDFIDKAKMRSIHSLPFDVNAGDQLIVLVTCSYTNNNGRFLLIGRELRENETVESIQNTLRD